MAAALALVLAMLGTILQLLNISDHVDVSTILQPLNISDHMDVGMILQLPDISDYVDMGMDLQLPSISEDMDVGTVLQLLTISEQVDVGMEQQMQQHQEQMSRLLILQELATMMQDAPSALFKRDVVFATWDLWQLGAFAGGLVLLLGLFWMSPRQENGLDKGSGTEEQEAAGTAPSLSPEQQPDSPRRRALESFCEQHLRGPARDAALTCQAVRELVDNLLHACHMISLATFLPRLEPCVGVGSAFEGWGHGGEATAYKVLVRLKPPPGHCFRLRPGPGAELPARPGRIRVKLQCMCRREQLLGDVLCFRHRSSEQVRRHQRPGLLHILCTDSYLDVEKTARWLQLFVQNAWDVIAEQQNCQLAVLPSSRSCQLQLTYDSGRTVRVEMVPGVQQNGLGVFVGSQEAEGDLSSTTWLESCALHELLFFRWVARQAPQGSCHLTCLQLLTYLLGDSVLSPVHLKTATMHLLTLLPPSEWCPQHLPERLRDILHYLHRCLEERQLHHFLVGNARVPGELALPAAFQAARPLNLLQRLAREPQAQALRELTQLRHRLQSFSC